MGQHHTQEYREYVAKLIVDEGRKATDVSKELEISIRPYADGSLPTEKKGM